MSDLYVCQKCGTPHLREEFIESRFCRNCGKFLTGGGKSFVDSHERRLPEREHNSLDLFPYDPYPQQLEFMHDVDSLMKKRKVLVAEACNGFGKTICSLSSILPLGKRIVYATRTHEQVRQVTLEVMEINRKAGTEFSAVALASRQNLCLNQVCKQLPPIEAQETCRALRNAGKCPYKADSAQVPSLPQILSIEILIQQGKDYHVCPYFLSRKAAETCTIVVAPYQYIFNDAIRAKVNLSLSEKILIFDEAHNADKIGQEALSDTLSEKALSSAKRELQLVDAPTAFIDDLDDYLKRNASKEATVRSASDLVQDILQLLGEELSVFIGNFTPLVEEIRTYKIGQGDVPICYLNGIINFFSLLARSTTANYVAIYRKSYAGFNLVEYRCLDPSLAIKPIIEEAYSALIMSGTLSPLQLFTEILGLPNAETRTYSAIARPENIRTYIDLMVTTKFQERNNEMMKLYGERTAKLMRKVPNGVLIFFPQRRLMLEAFQTWKRNKIIQNKGHDFFVSNKKLFIEGQRAAENTKIVEDYKEAARSSEGAVLLTVFRGRNAEGSNFPYDEARGIFLVGLPFADYHDPLVGAQIRYFDSKKPRLGEAWYLMDAFRAANQAIGRGIRHRDDWCHFFFMDRRYGTHWRFISKWATQNEIGEITLS